MRFVPKTPSLVESLIHSVVSPPDAMACGVFAWGEPDALAEDAARQVGNVFESAADGNLLDQQVGVDQQLPGLLDLDWLDLWA